MEKIRWARDLAEGLLAEPLPRRWAHSQEVGRKAESIAHIVEDEAENLICAAWLHDIGYAPDLVRTGLHSLDGARYLRDVARAGKRICRLVAHHSCAVVEARYRGLEVQLLNEFSDGFGIEYDALIYCDMTTSPDGESVDVVERLEEILLRYHAGDVVHKSIRESSVLIRRSVDAINPLLGMQPAE